MTFKAAIFYLTQNTVEKKVYLKTSLYFLFRNFNKKYIYPIIILHEGDYDLDSQREIVLSIRRDFRHLISFKQIDEEDFTVPQHIDIKKVQQIIDIKPVPYWRNLNYRLMCNFWINHFHKYTGDYDYIMRLDDDSIIEEPIHNNFFQVLHDKNLVYMSNIVHVDCGICNFQMKDLFENLFPNKKEYLKKLFISSKIPYSMKKLYENIAEIQGILGKDFATGKTNRDIETDMPIMYYNNFFVTSTAFWKRPDVCDVISKINENGGIFYYRYGDAPLQTLIVSMFEPEGSCRSVFKYSKRLQREVFKDGNNLQSYMPQNYDESSCIIKK